MYSVELHYDELQDNDCGVIEARGPEFALRDRRNPLKPELCEPLTQSIFEPGSSRIRVWKDSATVTGYRARCEQSSRELHILVRSHNSQLLKGEFKKDQSTTR
jgi:hypothetical protein